MKARTESKIDELAAAEELKKSKSVHISGTSDVGDDELDSEDERLAEGEEEEEKDVTKKMIYFKEAGIALGAYSVESLSKSQEFVRSLRGGQWEYNIVINKDMEKSMRYPIVDVKITYLDEDYRDLKFDEILAEMSEMGFNIKEI